MQPELSTEALIQLVRRYHSSDTALDESQGARTSPEAVRREDLLSTARKDTRKWSGFIQQLRLACPDSTVLDTTNLWHDACYTCRVSLPGHKPGDDLYDELVCMISLLAPVYALYASHHLDMGAVAESWLRFPPLPPGFEPHELTLASLIEAEFGATRLHRDVLSSPVPDLHPPGMPQGRETRLIDCLFTPNRY